MYIVTSLFSAKAENVIDVDFYTCLSLKLNFLLEHFRHQLVPMTKNMYRKNVELLRVESNTIA